MTKLIIILLLAVALQASGRLDDPNESVEESRVQTVTDGIRMRVWCAKSFPTNGNVKIFYSLANESSLTYKAVAASPIYDLKMEIIGPDGSQIKGYGESAESNRGGGGRMYIVYDLPPNDSGDREDGHPIPLSVYWPLKQVGEYRCVLKKTIFRADGRRRKSAQDEPGVPLVLVSPEFRFRIESIDHNYVSQLDEAAKAGEESQWGEEAVEGGGWGIYEYCMLGVTAAAFLFLGYTIRKRSKVATQVS